MIISSRSENLVLIEQPIQPKLMVMMTLSIMRMCALRSRHIRHNTAAPPRAILDAGKQAVFIRLAASGERRRGTVQAW